MNSKEFLYCYKMTHDTGFAPNVNYGVLTLATCKPRIRKCTREGYWISGWTSNKVQGKQEKYYFTDKDQRLIYIAKVSKVIGIAEYWSQYPEKRPQKLRDNTYDRGDNIYEPDSKYPEGFKQLENGGGHNSNNIKRDLSGLNVLICEEYYYFGVENAVKIEKDFVVHRWNKLDMWKAQTIIDQAKKYYAIDKSYDNYFK